MNTVHQEVQHEEQRSVGEQSINVEDESMKEVLQKRPNDIAHEETHESFGIGFRGGRSQCIN